MSHRKGPLTTEVGYVYVLTFAVQDDDLIDGERFDGVFADAKSAKYAAGAKKWNRSVYTDSWVSVPKHGVTFYIEREKIVRYTEKSTKSK